ncbi:hypothetical protein NP554_20805 [Pseudomonas asiatica]|uniref:Uncharacterized protein n=1 Tax=Pseudomonas asiatica TaxID=2219225 RepID=A0A9X4DCP3_9PSED|nr:hypothetical protein [Pseudomonas asiatica]MDD2114224.1 hypothetical protein [Pseudomonas asiatica]
MPTENRSSNTEMVSDKLPPCADDVFKNGVSACLVGDVPKHAAETICQSLSAVTGWKIDWHYFGGRTHIKALAPAPQPHPEPIAWMVGTAFWWTKEEAERDAAATGLPIVGLGPMAGAVPAEKYQGDPVGWQVRSKTNRPESQWTPWKECCEMTRAMHSHEVGRFNQFGIMREIRPVFASAANPGEIERCEARLHEVASLCASVEQERDTLRAQMAERDALLVDIRLGGLDDERCARVDLLLSSGAYANAINKHPLLRTSSDNAAIEVFLSASAEPTNDLCAEGAHEFVPFRSDCVKCGEPYSAEPSAQVERDERAEFLAWANEKYEVVEGYELNESQRDVVENWEGWQARAALERKPS